MKTNTLTVSQVNTYLKGLIEDDVIMSSVWVKGEISNFKHHSSGHMYMTLKDSDSVLKAVMFKGNTFKLRFMPEDGMVVLAHGRISVYEQGGQYQLYIDGLEPDGVGALYIAYEQLKNRLEAEGYFSLEHKKEIPQLPKKIAVVTSPTGAAVRDIINVISRRYPLCDICVYPALVQGSGAAQDIARAISEVNKIGDCDTIICGRGGGSLEDLWAFNEEVVAKAIYNSDIPVISAVGHETDYTIADFVADLRAPTPSAAAELAVISVLDLKGYISGVQRRINFGCKKMIDDKIMALKSVCGKISVQGVLNGYNQKRMYIDSVLKDIEGLVSEKLLGLRENLSVSLAKLHALSPIAVMARGYAAIFKDEKIVKSIDDINEGDNIKLYLKDGALYTNVTKKERKQWQKK
ncbi:MAG: exodeoxyribonuclease VII large subunit [Clostridia bacterium]|nr:exodeoxyribonuclease VII large subunit [Clostridia bacterium]